MVSIPINLRPSRPANYIVEQARSQTKKRDVGFAEALRFIKKKELDLFTNTFSIDNKSLLIKDFELAYVCSRLGSIVRDQYIGVRIRDLTTQETEIEFTAAEDRTSMLGDAVGISEDKDIAFSLTFTINRSSQTIKIDWLKSRQGKGSQILAALYNLAKDININQINFEVLPSNIRAQKFLSRTGFGQPQNSARSHWLANIREMEGRGEIKNVGIA